MMTLAPIRSSIHAAAYFERGDHADYYLMDDVCPSVWLGCGSELLGIKNQAVHSERFKRYLAGDIAGQKIGTEREGAWQHKPGWDLQFSPAKSISIAALVGGDERIINAHDRAVKEALNFLEQKAALIRVHSRDEKGQDVYKQVPTRNLLAAVFRHNTSRALDPQLHSHAVILNATQRSDGKWRSLESRHLYVLQKEAGLAYRQLLATSLRELGYELERTADANFEIAGISKSLLNAYSQRRNAVDQKLAELGYTRETAPAVIKERVAHEDRANKKSVERSQLENDWNKTAQQHDFNAKEFTQYVVNRAASQDYKISLKVEIRDQLENIVRQAIDSLSERDAVFSRKALEDSLTQLAVGYGIPAKQIAIGISWAEEQGMLVGDRETKSYSTQFQCWKNVEAFTTPQNLLTEQKAIQVMQAGRQLIPAEFNSREIENIIHAAELESQQQGYNGWTAGQKTAMRGILSSNDQFVALQGSAGTAKTSTVLKTIAAQYKSCGYI